MGRRPLVPLIAFVPNQQGTPDLAGEPELDHHRVYANYAASFI